MTQSGDTFRKCLSILLEISAKDNTHVLYLFPHNNPLRHGLHMMQRIIEASVPDFNVSIRAGHNLIKLGNGSSVAFRDRTYVEQRKYVGFEWHSLVEDGSMDMIYRTDQYRENLEELRTRIGRTT